MAARPKAQGVRPAFLGAGAGFDDAGLSLLIAAALDALDDDDLAFVTHAELVYGVAAGLRTTSTRKLDDLGWLRLCKALCATRPVAPDPLASKDLAGAGPRRNSFGDDRDAPDSLRGRSEDASRLRRGWDVAIPWRNVAATPRVPRG